MKNQTPEIINKGTEARLSAAKAAEEGGCGVIGFMASVPVRGQHIIEPSIQMHNRGNGKGGGIAAVGLSAADLGVTQDVLDSNYLLQVALLDPAARDEVERSSIEPYFDVAAAADVAKVDDFREVPGLEIKPPDVRRYFVRVKEDILAKYMVEGGCAGSDPRAAEDEFVFQNSFALNQRFYTSLGDKRAFVLSHGRNLMILKIVGFAEQAAQYYRLENFHAHGWIAHQRYPTKGRVWHPGGAHPFIGLNEALVHNGDFANYVAITEYLKQFGRLPQFLTDTEVAVLLFDLWNRRFNYPLEYIIEALAPTSEYDFDLLPSEKQNIYRAIQATHIASSPDGPWFFIIARNNVRQQAYELIGITDTSMLRPQVFALSDGEVQIGLVGSEKQAIDATLASLAHDDPRFCPVADKYWNARGGSATDGGSFIFRVGNNINGVKELSCVNKFGEPVTIAKGQAPPDANVAAPMSGEKLSGIIKNLLPVDRQLLESILISGMAYWDYATVAQACNKLASAASASDSAREAVIDILTILNDRRYDTGAKKRAIVLDIIRSSLRRVFDGIPVVACEASGKYARVEWFNRSYLREPYRNESVLVINAGCFPPEGEDCEARLIVAACKLGWRRFIGYGYRGQRFTGCGLGPDTRGVRIDVYDSPGDYLASGIDGLEVYVHASAQDQLGQIMKNGKLVIYGDVGQTFMYGSKGGEVYVLGSTAGRPLINAVGKPRVVINGTALDYLAESFMAGNPLQDGGFVILNGITQDEKGSIKELPTPYPGSNLFSLASGGAIYVRDPHCKLVDEQLNGGQYVSLTDEDWWLILPYLRENERLFGISVSELLAVEGRERHYSEVYRKVQPKRLAVLASAKATAGN